MAASAASVFANDRKKFLAAKLIQRSHLMMVTSGVCTKEKLPRGVGLTAYFAQYDRIYVPLSPLTEGSPPSDSAMTVNQVTATMDQWGIVLKITDVALMATEHPLAEQMQEMLADASARVIDREIQIVWLASTNVWYGDGSVTTRFTVTSGMTATSATLGKIRVYMADTGAPPRGGPENFTVKSGESESGLMNGNHYALICGPQVSEDIQAISASFGTWVSVQVYANGAKGIYQGEVGKYKGFRVIETNFIPKYTRLGNTTAAIASGAADGGGITGLVLTAVDGGGSLTSSTAHYFKFTRKDLLRGFEEVISIRHSQTSTATGNNESFTVLWPSTAGYAYNAYIGTTDADASLHLVAENVAPGVTTTITAVGTGVAPPGHIADAMTTVHQCYVVAHDACHWLGFQDLKYYEAGGEGGATIADPLAQQMTKGVKWMAKAMLTSSVRLMRVELASAN